MKTPISHLTRERARCALRLQYTDFARASARCALRLQYTALLCAAVSAAGCKKTIEAPNDLKDLSAFLFANFESEGGEELVVGTEELRTLLGKIELTAKANDRTFVMDPLKESDWGDITGPSGADPAEQEPRAVAGLSPHAVQKHVDLVEETNWVCIESETTVYSRREFLSDSGCFVSGDCETLDVVNDTRKESLIADVSYDYLKRYRHVELDDGTKAMLAKGWAEKAWPADGGTNSWDQQFSLEAWIEDGKESLRFHVFWSAVTLKGLPSGTYANLVESGLDEGLQFADAFIAGESDYCKNDRNYVPD